MRPMGKIGRVGGERAPRAEGAGDALPRRRQEAVRDDDAREAVLVLGGDAQADERAPVLADERRVAQVERPAATRVIQVTCRGTCSRAGSAGLSDRPKPTRSGASARKPGAREDRDHLPVQVAPRRLAVQHQDGRAVPRALVDVVDAQHAVAATST